jgi:hypothetical protein
MSTSDAKVGTGEADGKGKDVGAGLEVAITADMLFGGEGTVPARSKNDHEPALAKGTAGVNSLVRGVAGLLFLEHFVAWPWRGVRSAP